MRNHLIAVVRARRQETDEEIVDAILTEMRDPTEEMIMAGVDCPVPDPSGSGSEYWPGDGYELPFHYRAMIEAASK